MHRLGWRESSVQGNERKDFDVKVEFAAQKESLYWTAIMITGNAELAERSIVDATGLASINRGAFSDWLVEWAHVATARAAVYMVRSSVREAVYKYAAFSCPHKKHAPLSTAETQVLQEFDASVILEQLDVLARIVLVLHGCLRLSLSDCTLLLNVPLQTVEGAYCKARQWYANSAAPSERFRHASSRQLNILRRDADGVAVWG